MTAPIRRIVLGSALALACALPRPAPADESSFRPYLVGSRAAGMGGAFTALADDGSGPWYNPGGLAFVQRSQLSIAGSVYGRVSGRFQDALGDGHDFRYANLNTFPTATAGVWKLGDPGATDGHVLSLGVFIPDAVTIDDRDTIGSKTNAFFFSSQEQTVWGGLTWAKRYGRLGIGATGFLLFGTRVNQVEITAVGSSSAQFANFETLSSRTDENLLGVAGALGLRWDPTDDLRLGLSVYSPTLGGGKRRLFVKDLVALEGIPPCPTATRCSGYLIVNADDLHATLSQPLRVQAGLALVSGRTTLAADLVYMGTRQVHDDAGRAAEGLDRWVKRSRTVNFSVGLETILAERFPLRAGFFTDLSSSPRPVAWDGSGEDPNPSNTSHVNRLGGTFSIGMRTDHTATDVGVMVSGGSGTDLVPDNLDFTRAKPSASSQLLIYAFLGTSYEF